MIGSPVAVLVPFKSAKIPANSLATTFSSITPSSTFLSMYFISLFLSTFGPAPKTSSNTILNACGTLALPPIWPTFIANKLADPKLRICVAGE